MSLLGLFLQLLKPLKLASPNLSLTRQTVIVTCVFSICFLLIEPVLLMPSASAGGSSALSPAPDETNLALADTIITKTPEKPFRVVGYYSGDLFDDPVSVLQTDKLTHLMYAFLIPRVDGGLEPMKTEDKLIEIAAKTHRDGVKVFIAVGGWSYENAVLSPVFEIATAERESRDRLITNLCEFARKYDLDGVEIDWEYPNADTIGQYETFILELRAALTKEDKELTAALNGAWSADEGPGVSQLLSKVCLDCFDFVNIMAYDMNDAEHSPLWFANTSLDYWLNRGLPAEKLVLGLPLYALPSWMQYRDLIELDVSNAFRDFVATDPLVSYYNGLVTLREKTWIAMRKAGGVMLFDVNEDATGEYSALSMIQSVRNQAARMTSEQIKNHVMIILNNEELVFRSDDGLGIPFIDENYRTLIPLRKVMEALGSKVSYDEVNKTAILEKDGIIVLVPAGESYIVIKGNKAETYMNAVSETTVGGGVGGSGEGLGGGNVVGEGFGGGSGVGEGLGGSASGGSITGAGFDGGVSDSNVVGEGLSGGSFVGEGLGGGVGEGLGGGNVVGEGFGGGLGGGDIVGESVGSGSGVGEGLGGGSDISKADIIQVIDTKAIIIESRMYVPLRAIFNALGYDVGWHEVSRAAVIQSGSNVISS